MALLFNKHMSLQMSQTMGPCIETESTNFEETTINKGPCIRIQKNHPIENVIGSLNEGVITRSKNMMANS